MNTNLRILASAVVLIATHSIAHASIEAFRLDRIGIVRYTDLGDDRLKQSLGVLHSDRSITWGPSYEIPRPENTPAWILGRDLVPVDAWIAYYRLGPTALHNFERPDGASKFLVGDIYYGTIAVRNDAHQLSGSVVNISTRARVNGRNDVVIAGFVIEGRPRAVLIRAVGPTLGRLGVADALSDPFITVFARNMLFTMNDNWSDSDEADRIAELSSRIGAFPLEAGSLDAARVLILQPGSYTVHVAASATSTLNGTVLVEVYTIPEVDLRNTAN